MRGSSLWDHVRTLLVTLHLIAIGVSSLPSPVVLDEAALGRPAIQAQLRPWEQALGLVGVDEATFRAVLRAGSRAIGAPRQALTSWIQPYVRWCGVGQSWSMFGTVNHLPGRVEIWVEEEGVYTPAFIPLDPDADWRAHTLRSERMRSALNNYANGGQREAYAGFARWAARELAKERPGATRVKVQVVRFDPPEPEDLAATGRIPARPPTQVIEITLRETP